ncbi:hypothetical protein MMC28_003963 [Mycoblastus sanguinarius]|nr:hypothetical protein [Mycoblastus sanguinarius]
MNSTFFSLHDAQSASSAGKASLARGYRWVNDTQEYESLPWIDSPVVSGAGNTISNVLDYAKWLRCMMTRAPPLSEAAHTALRMPRINLPGLPFNTSGFRGSDGYALGWGVSNYRGEVMISHGGGLPGFGTTMIYLPRRQWGVTMMANSVEAGAISQQILTFELIDNLLDIPAEERFDWGATAESMLEDRMDLLKNARGILCSHAPREEDAIPLTLPLNAYAGIYWHPTYPTYNITIKRKPQPCSATNKLKSATPQQQEMLYAAPDNFYWSTAIEFHHVSGEHFLIYTREASAREKRPDDYDPNIDHVTKAVFRIGEDGKVIELGVEAEAEMADEKIWFQRR